MGDVQRTAIIAFGSVRTDLEPHLIANGEKGVAELSSASNIRTDTGAIRPRLGFTIVRRWGDNEAPVALWSRERFGPAPGGTSYDRDENGGLRKDFTAGGAVSLLDGTDTDTYWPARQRVMPGFAQLGGRIIFADGLNPNLIVGADGAVRPMGTLGQHSALGLTASTLAGNHLTLERYYAYGVRRVLTDGSLRLPSAMVLGSVTLTTTQNQVTVAIVASEYAAPPGWWIEYEVWRGTADGSSSLYRLVTLTTYAATVIDHTTDDALDMSQSYVLDENDVNYQFPPCRCFRTYKGRVFGAGATAYATGTLSTQVNSAAVTLATGLVRARDVDAILQIADESGVFVITAVNTATNTWTLDRVCTVTNATSAYAMQHPDDTIYVGNAQPLNIEGWALGEEIYAAAGSGNRIRALAEAAGNLYALREHRIEVIEGYQSGWMLTPIQDSPPGPVSSATVADGCSPRVYYYAGRSGVVELAGTQARIISDPIKAILRDTVLHQYDEWTHGVYDPATALYHLWVFRAGDVQGVAGSETWFVPSLLLTYDTRKECWYPGVLAATCSGIWKDAAGAPYAAIGILGGVARLEQGISDGSAMGGTALAGSGVNTLKGGVAIPHQTIPAVWNWLGLSTGGTLCADFLGVINGAFHFEITMVQVTGDLGYGAAIICGFTNAAGVNFLNLSAGGYPTELNVPFGAGDSYSQLQVEQVISAWDFHGMRLGAGGGNTLRNIKILSMSLTLDSDPTVNLLPPLTDGVSWITDDTNLSTFAAERLIYAGDPDWTGTAPPSGAYDPDATLDPLDVRGLPILLLRASGQDELNQALGEVNHVGSLFDQGWLMARNWVGGVPAEGDTWQIGAIQWSARTGDLALLPRLEKQRKIVALDIRHAPAAATLDVAVTGAGADSARALEASFSMANDDTIALTATRLGLRSGAAIVSVSGVAGLVPSQAVTALVIETVDTK